MANELQVFNFKGNDTRVVEIDGQPWWVAKRRMRDIRVEQSYCGNR